MIILWLSNDMHFTKDKKTWRKKQNLNGGRSFHKNANWCHWSLWCNAGNSNLGSSNIGANTFSCFYYTFLWTATPLTTNIVITIVISLLLPTWLRQGRSNSAFFLRYSSSKFWVLSKKNTRNRKALIANPYWLIDLKFHV